MLPHSVASATRLRTVNCRSSLLPCTLPLTHSQHHRALTSASTRTNSTRLLFQSQPHLRYSTASLSSVSPEAAKVAEQAESQIEADPLRKIGYLYFDTVFPIRLGFWDLRHLLARFEKRSVLDRIKASIPPDEDIGYGFHVVGAEERMKDGGAFVTFSYRANPDQEAEDSLDHIEATLQNRVKRIYSPSMLFFGTPGVHVVRGKPFREDMNIFPSQRVQINLNGGDASEEQLWEILRPYGRILYINKEKPGEALVTFSRMRGATSARNCAHGYTLKNGARMVVTFRSHLRGKQLWEWISGHPRIVLPILAFLVGGLSYVIFDPIREFMVESKIRNTFSLDDYKVYAWLKDKTVNLFHDQKDNVTIQDDWWERRQAAQNIQEWIREPPSTFITISGPRGSGKGGLLSKSITKDVEHLVIDCEAIARAAKNDAALVSSLATETGYWPVFGWLNSLNNMIDLAAVGLIGSKAGFATAVDAQLKQVLGVTANSLLHINQDIQKRRQKEKAEAEKQARSHPNPVPAEKTSDSVDVNVAPDQIATRIQSQKKTFDSPVVVIKHFHHKSIKQTAFHTVLAEWAAELVNNGIAHVVFVSDNPVAMGKELAKALPNRPFQNVVLADADEDKARSYVFNKLKELGKLPVPPPSAKQNTPLIKGLASSAPDADPAPTSLDPNTAAWVDKLGGRLTDLESLVQKVSLGQSVWEAVEEIISRSVIELRKNAFGEDASESKALSWDREHAWAVIKELAEKEEINYYGLLHGAFKSKEEPLKALEQAEIISVRHFDGRPSRIRAGRPVMQQAMARLVRDEVFASTQTLLSNAAAIESSERTIRSIEEEIRDISHMIQGSPFKVSSGGAPSAGLFSGSNEPQIGATDAARARTHFLMAKMADLQMKVSKLDAENAQIKSKLVSESDY